MSPKPWSKKQVREWMKECRESLRLCEKALQRDDYFDAYQMIYQIAGSGEILTDRYERWEMHDE